MSRSAALDPSPLDDALDRVRELSLRLWAVREAHPVCRTLLRGLRCRTCGQAWPCATVRATAVYDDGGAVRSSP